MTTENQELKSVTELAKMIRSGEASASGLLEKSLARYEAFNERVNAVVVTRIEEAKKRAAEADAAAARGEYWGPLHGIPMTIKEAYDWTDTASTWGNLEWVGNIPRKNAVAVQRLLDAGAVIWGKTNVPFMLADWQSYNEIYGCTNNPWDLDRTPGGSSGGSAVALATGMSALELGSDIGASIRNPAHYVGVFGHKPTYGLVPQDGSLPPGCETAGDISVCGPLARSASDLDLALSVLAGPAGYDQVGYRVELPPATQNQLSDFRVGVLLESPACETDQQLVNQLQNTVDQLAKAGLSVVDSVPEFDQQEFFENYLMLLRAANGAAASDGIYAGAERGARAWQGGDRSYRNLVDYAMRMSHREWSIHDEQRTKYRMAWANYFEEYDLLLCPTAASTAFVHDHEGERPERTIKVNGSQESVVDQLFWAGLSCSVYLPSTVAPAGLAEGLPAGLQIVAPHLHDRRSIRFAELMENEIGGFISPPGYDTI